MKQISRAPTDSLAPDLPRGLMVFSAASFSLGPPLDISAAMEKALAREESWGLGDAVNSMVPSVRSCSGTWPAKPQSSFPEGRQRPETQLKVPESRQNRTGDSRRVRSLFLGAL